MSKQMLEVPEIRFLVENFRAVNQADIIVNGITVVAGENGSGKSSISKLLYFLYKTVAGYETVVKMGLWDSLRDVYQLLEIIYQELRVSDYQEPKEQLRREVSELRRSLTRDEFIDDVLTRWVEMVLKMEEIFILFIDSDSRKNSSRKPDRVRYILQDIVKTTRKDENIKVSFNKLRALIESRFIKAKEMIDFRPTSVFVEELGSIFSNGELPAKFEVQEYGDIIVALDKEQLSIPYSIQNAIYIDSPMMFHAESSTNFHWDDLSDLLQKRGNENHTVADIITNEIIQGDIIAEEATFSAEDLKFKRSDGEIFNLLDVATGIKSFSILQMLLKNGSITDKTLLIIDEPESNLHPQWIIEYARIIVMLNKLIGVKFFLATHNPDMVSAIRYISEKEGTLDGVNFYLAEKSATKFKYNYSYLDKEIDPIFASFNIALERINQYGI